MKFPRSDKDYGGGSGRTIFESTLFRVLHWKLQKGNRTTLDLVSDSSVSLSFDGHLLITSDAECLEQFSYNEIATILVSETESSYDAGREAGERDKAEEIKNALGL